MENYNQRFELAKEHCTKSERKILEQLESISSQELIGYSITEIAEKVEVGEATFLRFCRKLGYKGFQHFKLALSMEMEAGANENMSMIGSLAQKMTDSIHIAQNEIEEEVLKEISQRILGARRLCVFGIGHSSLTAQLLKLRLIKLGIIVQVNEDPHIQSIEASHMTKEDYGIICSVSGSTLDMISIANILKQNGVEFGLISSKKKSPMVTLASQALLSGENVASYEAGSVSTLTTQSFMVHLIVAYTQYFLGAQSAEKESKSNKAVIEKLI